MQFTKNVDFETHNLPLFACRIAKRFAWLPTRFNYYVSREVGHRQIIFWLEYYYYLEVYDRDIGWHRHYYWTTNEVGRDTRPFTKEDYEDWLKTGSPIFTFNDYNRLAYQAS